MLTTRKKDFIEFMMSADVLRFGEFQTKSGRLTPYFINTGNYKTGGQIAALGRFYAALIHETCGDRFDAMFGPPSSPCGTFTSPSRPSRPMPTSFPAWKPICGSIVCWTDFPVGILLKNAVIRFYNRTPRFLLPASSKGCRRPV